MNVVLDTCAVLALATGGLSARASGEIRRADQARVSSVTAWEIAIKVASSKLQLSAPPDRWFADLVARYRLQEVPVDAGLACAAAALPARHRDPFDRAIVALARATDSILITSDARLGEYPGVVARW